MTLSIILCVISVILTLFVLLHKSKGGGLSDLFGGGVSTSMGGHSVAERNLDRLTVVVGVLWLACIVALLAVYRYGA
jgi:preprotein translocase subunit SecG